MPFITIDTNSTVPSSKETLAKMVDLVALILNKPKDYIVVKLNTNMAMAFGAEPENIGALIEIKSIGYHGKISELATALTTFCSKNLGAQSRYVCIHFVDMPATNVAQDGRTFA